VRDQSSPGRCTKTDQDELLGVWNGLNWLGIQCSNLEDTILGTKGHF